MVGLQAYVLKRALVLSALIARGTTWASSCSLHCPCATQPHPTPYLQPQPHSLLTPPPPSTPFLPSSKGSASASPSTPPIQGPEAASKAVGCSASPNYPAVCASSSFPPPPPQSVQPGSAFHCCLGSVHLESHAAEHAAAAEHAQAD
ncbi:hypothetical protein V8C86DRAFT_2714936 [Haematococcus lacustris]